MGSNFDEFSVSSKTYAIQKGLTRKIAVCTLPHAIEIRIRVIESQTTIRCIVPLTHVVLSSSAPHDPLKPLPTAFFQFVSSVRTFHEINPISSISKEHEILFVESVESATNMAI